MASLYSLLKPSELSEVKLRTNVRNVDVDELSVRELRELYQPMDVTDLNTYDPIEVIVLEELLDRSGAFFKSLNSKSHG